MRYQATLGGDVGATRFLVKRGITKELALTNRLGVVSHDPLPEHRRYVGWLAVPYLGVDGRPVQIRFRCLQEHDHGMYRHGKYMTLEGDPARVFHVESILKADFEIHVTEGELDAMILNALGYPAVAIPGAAGFQGHHKRMLAGFQRVYVWGDPDEAGSGFASKITRMMPQAIAVRLTVGDVNETYLQHGEKGIHDALAEVL